MAHEPTGAAHGASWSLDQLKRESGVSFGTSGVRGLVTGLTDRVCYVYTLAFLQYLRDFGGLLNPVRVAVGGDLRPSTPRMVAAVSQAITDFGGSALNCGALASPALAYYGLAQSIPTVMVTGSHIPADRNGIKFNTAQGEISKADETGITSQAVILPEGLFDEGGMLVDSVNAPPATNDAWDLYQQRYLDFFGEGFLAGQRLGVYQHSAVLRDVMVALYAALGAQVTPLGRSDTFIPVDTEAIREEDTRLAREWAANGEFDALVSTDGDSDRPLLSDEHGNWLRGDVAGILVARYLNADSVTTPVSSNTAVERCGWFDHVARTRIGSPYVIAAMEEEQANGFHRVVGYEANGGFLLATDIERDGKTLRALPTRDAVLVHLAILGLSFEQRRPISRLLAELPQRFTYSDRLKEFPTEKSQAILKAFMGDEGKPSLARIEEEFGPLSGKVETVDTTDGLRITFASDIIHLRPSGNAPEFRCYTEADSTERAETLNHQVMAILRDWKA